MNQDFMIAIIIIFLLAILLSTSGKNYFLGYDYDTLFEDLVTSDDRRDSFDFDPNNPNNILTGIVQPNSLFNEIETFDVPKYYTHNMYNEMKKYCKYQTDIYNDKLNKCNNQLNYLKRLQPNGLYERCCKDNNKKINKILQDTKFYYNKYRDQQNVITNLKATNNYYKDMLNHYRKELMFCNRYLNMKPTTAKYLRPPKIKYNLICSARKNNCIVDTTSGNAIGDVGPVYDFHSIKSDGTPYSY
jgi:hypothetical protein